MDKNVVRTHLLNKRKRLTFKRRNAKSEQIITQLLTILQGHKSIGLYLSLKDEVSTLDYLNHFLSNFESVSSPVVVDNDLVFYKINTVRELKSGYMEILEPIQSEVIEKQTMDAIIVPLVGFDKHNNRIGYGKGFYDRYLMDYEHLTIGLAFDDQEYPHIPHDNQDVPLDYIVTETRIFKK